MFSILYDTLINLFSEPELLSKFISNTTEVQTAVKATGTALFNRTLQMFKLK